MGRALALAAATRGLVITTDQLNVGLLLREREDSPLLHSWSGMVVVTRVRVVLCGLSLFGESETCVLAEGSDGRV